ncbi:hypothetical protein N7534_007943 [Penicillium rubens]|nr:hypothetical protein N7534_007943 [Penicillium rubens]
MRKPDDEFINQFWEKYGDLFLSCQGEKETGGVQFDVSDPVLPVSYVKGYEPIDTAPTDEANTGQTSGRESGYSKHHSFHATDSSSPMSDVKKRETIHDRNLSRPSGVFYNNEGDIPSPLIQWNANISPILDKQVRSIPQSFWNAFDCVTPLAEPQGCLHGNTHFEQVDAISTTLVHHDFKYAALDGVDQDIFTCCSKQSDPIFDLATPKAQVNEKFRYNVTLQAPTAMRQHGNEKPVTYLNMGQPYRLTVADSTPPQRKAGAFEYRTFVHVSFEGEDQRSNPVASWQLWKESRGLKEAHERKGKVLAVKFIHPSQGDARNQGQCQVQMGRSSVNGFCVTWTADPTANVYEAAIVLKFHFVSTDFTRSKGG